MAKAMQPQKLYFSQAMQTEKYKNLINNTLRRPGTRGTIRCKYHFCCGS